MDSEAMLFCLLYRFALCFFWIAISILEEKNLHAQGFPGTHPGALEHI
jgi:hypothetical protein